MFGLRRQLTRMDGVSYLWCQIPDSATEVCTDPDRGCRLELVYSDLSSVSPPAPCLCGLRQMSVSWQSEALLNTRLSSDVAESHNADPRLAPAQIQSDGELAMQQRVSVSVWEASVTNWVVNIAPYCGPGPSIVTDIVLMCEPIWGHYRLLLEALCEFFMISVDVSNSELDCPCNSFLIN